LNEGFRKFENSKILPPAKHKLENYSSCSQVKLSGYRTPVLKDEPKLAQLIILAKMAMRGPTIPLNQRFLKPQDATTSPPMWQPAQAPSKLQPDIQTPTMWTPPTSQPAKDVTVAPHITKSSF
jgi:hypothetical protein